MSCDEVLRLLQEREAACHSEAERLGAEAERTFTRTTSRSRGRCWCRTGSISVPPPRRLDVTARTDGRAHARAEHGHVRQLATTVERVDISRVAYRSPAPDLHVPGNS